MPRTLGAAEPVPSSLVSTIEAAPGARAPRRRPALLVHTQAFGPALIVAMVLALIIGPGLIVYGGNPTGFIRFGREWVRDTHPPAGAVIDTRTGYDGQYFWALARDPLLLHQSTADGFHGAGFRLDRIAYPALAYALAAGQEGALPWTLLMINVLVVIAITVAFAAYARGRGGSGWWALAVGLLPGLQFATMGDVSDALAVAAMLGGLMMWEQGRRWPAAGLLAVAVLAREPMMLAVLAVAVDAGARGWRRRREPRALRATVRAAWPAIVIPTLVFVAWQAYVHLRHGVAGTGAPATAFQPPLVGLLAEFRRALDGTPTVAGSWDLAYLAAMVAGIGAAFALVRRRLSAPGIAAVLFGLVLTVLTFGGDWSYTRLSAPLFAVLLLGGLERGSRPALAVCATVAALGAAVPFVLG
jgi:hypothetical protein